MRKLSFLVLILLFSCKTKNVFVTDYLEITKYNGTKDTITNSYWNKFYMDEYKMEWMLRNKGILPKDVQNIELIKTSKKKFTKEELNK